MKFSVKLMVQTVTVATALLLTNMLQAAPAFQFPAYEKVQLENGLTIYLLEQHEVPLMTVNVTVKAGAILDNKAGLANSLSFHQKYSSYHIFQTNPTSRLFLPDHLSLQS